MPAIDVTGTGTASGVGDDSAEGVSPPLTDLGWAAVAAAFAAAVGVDVGVVAVLHGEEDVVVAMEPLGDDRLRSWATRRPRTPGFRFGGAGAKLQTRLR